MTLTYECVRSVTWTVDRGGTRTGAGYVWMGWGIIGSRIEWWREGIIECDLFLCILDTN